MAAVAPLVYRMSTGAPGRIAAGDSLRLGQQTSAPAAPPAAGSVTIYPKADGKLYSQGSSGVETLVG